MESAMELLRRLNLQDRYENKLTPAEVLQVKPTLKHDQELQETDLCAVYLSKLLMLDYRARYIQAKQENTNVGEQYDTDDFFYVSETADSSSDQNNIHPMDLQMAVFLCSDSFLRQMMVTKLSQCQYALPLLVPDPTTGIFKCPLWTFRKIKKTWKKTETKDEKTSVTLKSKSICEAETAMVLCFRLGSLSVSKSQLINTLINNAYSTFFHRNCRGSSKTRLLFDGVVEIAWYCPAGKPTDNFSDCLAFCNLRGDGLTNTKQVNTLMDMSSVNVIFVPTLDRKHESAVLIQRLLDVPKPLIVLVDNIGKRAFQSKPGKYIVGLKERNEPDISEDLRITINTILSEKYQTFQLKSMSKCGLKVDESDASSKKALSSAKEVMEILESVPASDAKNTFLPCQGKYWHEWSSKSKERYHLKENGENEKAEINSVCNKLRKKQREASGGKLVMTFMKHIFSLDPVERMYLLKWTEILLDDYAVTHLSVILQNYHDKWSEVLDLKKQLEEKEKSENPNQKRTLDNLKSKQDELAKISKDLQSATCGLEHIFREIGQIYEAHENQSASPKQEPCDWPKYPALAADLMLSGHPMELMDGDAGHVPLAWISKLLQEVAQKLGDQKVFVLSVLGIQSSGKSTMLNAMFGLQFAVSAGRCTRGAFMQLLKLSEDMKKTGFDWDYVLVVDTEGLRALELEGNKTIQHDNELATFVVGLGNMTLVNIFGENPSEMHEVLQIVVQAMMRMKKVRLSPSCVFVHQNVTDVSASEQNMDGRRKLLEKLDAMVKLAAEEEVCDAQRFSDIIKFDIQKDVKYFAQLWEGSPPMAPPNPGYSESIQDLRTFILEKAKGCPGVPLTAFKSKVEDLWKALLSENFVFNFKNTLEIAVYRKLEIQYGNWTWGLREAMLKIEENCYRQIRDQPVPKPISPSDLRNEINQKNKEIQDSMTKYFDEDVDKDLLIQWRAQHERKVKDFLESLVKELHRKLNNVIEQKKATAGVEQKKADFESNLLQQSKKLALELKDQHLDDHVLLQHFDHDWRNWVSKLTSGLSPPENIDFESEQTKALLELGFEWDIVRDQKESKQYKTMLTKVDYTNYVGQKHNEKQNLFVELFDSVKKKILPPRLAHQYQEQIKDLIQTVEQESRTIEQKPVKTQGFNSSYLREMGFNVIKSVQKIEKQWKQPMKKELTVDLIMFVFDKRKDWILRSHNEFMRSKDIRTQLESQKCDYFNVFKSYCRGNSSAVILAEMIYNKLKEQMIEDVHNEAALSIASKMRADVPELKENKHNLDKHILKSLAEKKDFNEYMQYIRQPKAYTEEFLKKEVENLLQSTYKDECREILQNEISAIKRDIICALHNATQTTTENKGDLKTWLETFTRVQVNADNFSDVKDYEFLEKQIKDRLESISAELEDQLDTSLGRSRQRPDQILTKHLQDYCWEACPFCHAVCTGTIGNHSGDHSNPFHRSPSLIGNHYWKTDNMWVNFCTTDITSNGSFHPNSDERIVPFLKYRDAGHPFNKWKITADTEQLLYWQWVVCTFKTDLEKKYSLRYTGHGNIPSDWFKINQKEAIENLEKYYI